MLRSRTVFPPGGFFFRQAQTGWPNAAQAEQMAGHTFDQWVTAIIEHRKANPRFNLPTDREIVEFELEVYTVARLKGVRGAAEYLTGDVELPKHQPLRAGHLVAGIVGAVGSVATGVEVLLSWLGEGGKAVAPGLAEQRAETCLRCPKHRKRHWHEWAKDALASRIRDELGIKNDSQLTTSRDSELMTCDACLCWMPLKVHTPIGHIVKHMRPGDAEKLDAQCWVVAEKVKIEKAGTDDTQ